MKKVFGIIACFVLLLTLTACGANDSTEKTQKKEEPLNLYGTWTQTNNDSKDSYQEAVISKDGTITINWVMDDTKSLYWAGSFDTPTTAGKTYSWTSKNDKTQTENAMLASGDDTKVFKYDNGVLSYEASALGSTTTIKLERK